MDWINTIVDFGKDNLVYGLVGTLGLFFIKKVRDTAFSPVRHLGRQLSTALRKKSTKLEEAAEAAADKLVEATEEFRDGMKDDNK